MRSTGLNRLKIIPNEPPARPTEFEILPWIGRFGLRTQRESADDLPQQEFIILKSLRAKMTRQRLFTARQAANWLGVSLNTLHRIEQAELLVPYRTPGGHRRYSREMLEYYLETSRENWKDVV